MMMLNFFCLVLSCVTAKNKGSFPKDFLFGAASASYQVEGAWNEDGKGENIWDRMTHTRPDSILNREHGDIAADSYHKYKEDVALAAGLGLTHYRFSISWSRILPSGYDNYINPKGISYYKNLIDEILKRKMIPVATIYHWDLPQPLQDIGGWTNPLLVGPFVNFARIVIGAFKGVGYWITINEPKQMCNLGYGTGEFAPGINDSGRGDYLCAYMIVKCHAATYRMYKKEFPHYKAKMSIVLDGEWNEAASNKPEDIEAAERKNQFEFGLYANPIFNGDWPRVVIDRVAERSALEGYSESRLPRFTKEEIDYIKGTYDYLGFNTYTTFIIADAKESSYKSSSYANDLRVVVSKDPRWKSGSNGNSIVPKGARKMLRWIKNNYNNPKIFVIECGVSDDGTTLNDDIRISFLTIYNLCFITSCVTAKNKGSFPKDFLFGAASASYQVEGAWNEDGKGENIWDRMTHTRPDSILNREHGDIAADSYHKYKEDVALAAGLGLTHYRFSISWSRILPSGYDNYINPKGISYYKNLIDEILKRKMIPVATIYHWDLPQPLQDIGGWTNPLLVGPFVNFARIVIGAFKGVGYWITINEPKQMCNLGYGTGEFAPGINDSGRGDYLCAYMIVKCHAATYRMYKKEFPHYKAKMSIVLDGEWNEAASNKPEDIEAAERKNQFEFGLYANPIFNGDWPRVVIDRVAERSALEGYSESRLPRFTKEEIDYIKGTYDYLGFNTYTTFIIADAKESSYKSSSYANDLRVVVSKDPRWKSGSNGNSIVPKGARKMLRWIKNNYNNPKIFVIECGVSDDGTTLNDDIRISFLTGYLSAILDAMYEDGVRVFGFTAWSLIDNFEWTKGYSQHFGLYQVNFTDPNRTRTPKKSTKFYRQLAKTHRIPKGYTTT